jgi:dimethylaniline monooxygenase (N-oxide forming)
MEQRIDQVQEWSKRVFPARSDGYFIGAYIAHYTDDLMWDMGLRTRRASNVLSEYLAPLRPARYRTVSDERRRLCPDC